MSRPGVGNPGSHGGGRPSAYEERARAELLSLAFFGDIDIEEMKKKLEDKKKKNLWDIWLAKALSGNETFLVKMFDKVFPSKSENYNRNEYVQNPLTPEEQQARVNQLLDELNTIATSRRVREGNGGSKSLLFGELHPGVRPHNGETTQGGNGVHPNMEQA